MSTTEIKNIAEAATELTRKTAQNMTEINIKAWKDLISFGDVLAKAQADAVKSFAPGYGYQEMLDTFSKMQNDAIKAFSSWSSGSTSSK